VATGKGKRLTALAAAKMSKAGRYAAGDGLYLQVTKGGSKSWIFRYQRAGQARHMGLGGFDILPLAEARQRAQDARKLLLDDIDPLENRRAQRVESRAQAARGVTFKRCAEEFIASQEVGWRNSDHRRQWRSTLERYAYPVLGDLPVAAIDGALVLRVLQPIWGSKPETASRVRGRIESILSRATVLDYRGGENPARWRGNLEYLLSDRKKVRAVKHHPALPYSEVSTFLADLRGRHGTAARALEVTILTALRSGEVLGTRWPEFDLQTRVWTIPKERMKGGREHKVPLSDRVIEIVESLPRDSEFVFAGLRRSQPLNVAAMLRVISRMKRTGITTHGFRSSFRDWASETTNHPNHVVEMALAHAIGDDVEAAYRRGDLLEKRRQLMAEWSEYCAKPATGGDNVLPLRRPAKSKKREAADHADV
jgi:integrase